MKQKITILLFMCLASACAHEIGDDCKYDVDCSANMDRQCDRTQPGGYCLIIGCGPDECPSEASCVEFTTPCPEGEGYDDDKAKCQLLESNRGRTYCLRHCGDSGDCRSGYQCKSAKKLSAAVIDFDSQNDKICVPN